MVDELNNFEPLQEELERIKKQADEYLNGWRRTKADMVNFQRQTEREREEWARFSNASCVSAFLPILESLERATDEEHLRALRDLENATLQSHIAGIIKIRDQFMGTLEKMGVEPIKCLGEPVNTEFHEVMAKQPSDHYAPGLISQEVQKGFLLHGRVLRPAKVIVAE